MGSACSICGYNKSIAALDFHHTDPKEKDFGIAQIGTWTWSKIKQELDKCILVCANCHRELEYNNNKQEGDSMAAINNELTLERQQEIYLALIPVVGTDLAKLISYAVFRNLITIDSVERWIVTHAALKPIGQKGLRIYGEK